MKRKRLKRVMGTLPSHVVFVPMDVRRDALHVMLHRAGFDPTRPAFFLGEGFVPYLEAIARAGYRGSASVELEFPPAGVPIRDWVEEARSATAGPSYRTSSSAGAGTAA